MNLFGKKKESKATPLCACNGNTPVMNSENMSKESCCCESSSTEINNIKVLGSGCKSCHALFENTKEAVKNLSLSVEVEYVTDMEKVMTYGVMSMPALVVNEKVVSMGKVLKSEDIEKLLHKLGF